MPSKPPLAPQPPDLPETLQACGELESLDGLELEASLVERVSVAGGKASDLRLDQCRLLKLDLSGAELVRASATDSAVDAGSWANVRSERLRFNRVAFKGVRMTGANLASAILDDVSFTDCRMDLASFALARLKRVRFVGCKLDEADFFGASLNSVEFHRCSLIRGRWTDVTVSQSQMRGCELAGSIDLARLRGMRMPMEDVLANAEVFADALGFDMFDRRTS